MGLYFEKDILYGTNFPKNSTLFKTKIPEKDSL